MKKIEADRLVRLNELKLKLILENIGGEYYRHWHTKDCTIKSHGKEIIGVSQEEGASTTLDWLLNYDLFYPDAKRLPVQNLPLEKRCEESHLMKLK
jgi:hypothetical protein